MAPRGGVLLMLACAASLFARCLCTEASCPLATASGNGFKWPDANPALVGPVTVMHSYQMYRQPVEAEMTESSIMIRIPPDFYAGFNLTNENGTSREKYVLRSIEIRKPGWVAESASQVLSHSLEVVLMHGPITGDTPWASIVVPFTTEVGDSFDMISALLAGSTLPMSYGERQPLLVAAVQPLDLSEVFTNGTFLTYWTRLPTYCQGFTRPARQLMRNSTMVVSQESYAKVLAALESAPLASPITPPADAWLVGSCQSGDASCQPLQAVDLSGQLLEAQTLQSQAIAKVRADKDTMDQALIALRNVTDATYDAAVKARDELADASAELDASTKLVDKLQAWIDQAESAVWNSDAPVMPMSADSPSNTSGSAGPADGRSSGAQTTAEASAEAASSASLLAAGRRQRSPMRAAAGDHPGDCLAQGRSPIDINSASAAVLQAGLGSPREPIVFLQTGAPPAAAAPPAAPQLPGRAAGIMQHAPLRLFNTAEYLRLMAPVGEESPLGAFTTGGDVIHSVAFADLHVPGEHTINGKRAAAELQLVHLPKKGDSAIAVAVLFDLAQDGADVENPWLASVLQALPAPQSQSAAQAPAAGLGELHPALQQGSAEEYFRYDGTLTRSPCRSAEWYVLDQRGRIGSRQLAALRAALPLAAAVPGKDRGPFKASSLVAEGVWELPTALMKAPEKPRLDRAAGLLGKFRGRGQRQIAAV